MEFHYSCLLLAPQAIAIKPVTSPMRRNSAGSRLVRAPSRHARCNAIETTIIDTPIRADLTTKSEWMSRNRLFTRTWFNATLSKRAPAFDVAKFQALVAKVLHTSIAH